ETGDAEGAVEDLTRAIELGEDAALLYNRATALLALGRTEEAVRDLQRAHALDPDDPDIDLALRRHAPRRTAAPAPGPPGARTGGGIARPAAMPWSVVRPVGLDGCGRPPPERPAALIGTARSCRGAVPGRKRRTRDRVRAPAGRPRTWAGPESVPSLAANAPT